MGTSISRTSNIKEVHKLGLGYGMPGSSVDGMDVETVHAALYEAAEYVRSGKGPYFLEINTYRYRGHSVSDPANYRTKEELEEYKGRDPIHTLETKMLKDKIASQEQIDEVQARITQEIDDAVVFAEESPFPDGSELYEDNYVQKDYPYLT
jgi:pyruvate dehydrogenase E1 component alpha subunit